MRFPWSRPKHRYLVEETTYTPGRGQQLTVTKLTYDNHMFRAGDVIEVKGHFGTRVGGTVRNGDPTGD